MEDLQKKIQISLCFLQREIEDFKKDPLQNYICDLKNCRYSLSEIIEISEIKGFSEEEAHAIKLKEEVATLIAYVLLD